MFVASLIGTGAWFSDRCLLTWKIVGIKSSRFYFQLRVSEPPTAETGFGLLPIVKACEIDETPEQWSIRRENPKNKMMGPSLTVVAKMGLLPTPVVMDTNCGDPERIDKRRATAKDKGYNGNGFGQTLGELANRKLLPTPQAYDYNSARTPGKWEKDKQKWKEKGVSLHYPLKQMAANKLLPMPRQSEHKGTGPLGSASHKHRLDRAYLDATVQEITGSSGQLSHRFVGELMGFPPSWTELPFLSSDGSQSRPTAMQ